MKRASQLTASQPSPISAFFSNFTDVEIWKRFVSAAGSNASPETYRKEGDVSSSFYIPHQREAISPKAD